MHLRTVVFPTVAAAALAAGISAASPALAQQKEVKIGVIYDYTGPLAASGSRANALGTKIAIDMINERGGVEGYKIVPIYADAQSKVEVAVGESARLYEQEKVALVLGVFSSAQCVPLAQSADAAKRFMWLSTCIAADVFKGKNLRYVFRAQVQSDQFGAAPCAFLNENAKAKLGRDPKDLKVAIIHEDGPYGTGTAAGNERACAQYGMQIVVKEGYPTATPDLSGLVAKLKRAQPDVILHTAYNPDLTLFWRQAREQGLKWAAIIGHGAGYSQYDRLREVFGKDSDHIFNVDPPPAQLLDPRSLAPGLGSVIQEMVRRYKVEAKTDQVTSSVSIGFNQAWILLTDVLPRAIKKYGGTDTEALRKAALDTDIPDGGTVQGYGVKFFAPGTEMAGQNERSTPDVVQYAAGKIEVVWPTRVRTAEPVLPLPKTHGYSNQQ